MPKNNFADDSETESKVAEALAETTEETSEEVAPSKIKVGEVEYDQSELESLVGLGKLGREMEEKWNTKIDKVYPEYTKSQNDKKALEQKLAEIESRAKTSIEPGESQGDTLKEAQEAARKLGIVLKDDFKDSFRDYYLQERAAEKLIETGQGYEKEIDGKDGRPAFKTQEILEYMAEEGIKDPMKAYKFKYEKELDSWKETELGKSRKPGLATDDSTGGLRKSPKDVRPTTENLNELVAEALRG